MPSRLKKAIGAVKDQTSISLAKVNNSSQLEVTVLKATTHDDVPIDERYVYEVLQLISSNKIYAAACARAIGKRISRTRNWIVALKSLMLVLRIFQDGDPYFPREVLHAMKRGSKILNLSNFRDDSNSSPWDFTAFVRTFALYLDERLDCFLTGKLQRRYTHKEREGSHSYRRRTNESVRDMKPSMLLDRIIYWQRLLERAIATRPTGQAKANRLVQISLYAVVRESFDLYKDISDGLALLLDSFFHLQYQSCVSAFQICVKAAKQFEELSAFYSLCKTIGVGRTSEYPSVQNISEELIETLQEFLKDQSSFPSHTRPPSKPLLLPGLDTGSPSGRHDSYGGQSQCTDFSTSSGRLSEKASEFGSQCTSLEDLISATETGRSPSISIDLEAYSDQFEKKSQLEEPFRVSDTGSTQSLPVTNSMVDLLSIDDWPDEEKEQKAQRQEQEKKQDLLESILVQDSLLPTSADVQSQPTSSTDLTQSNSSKDLLQSAGSDMDRLQSSSTTGWELVLAESVTPSSQSQGNNFGAFQNPQEQHGFNTFSVPQESGSTAGWELVLAGTPTRQQSIQQTDIFSDNFNPSTAITLYDQPQHQHQTPLQPLDHYNPFLQDLPVIPTANSPTTSGFEPSFQTNMDPFSTAPAFQATTTTLSAQNQIHTTGPLAMVSHGSQSDPFATMPCSTQDDPFATAMPSNQKDSFAIVARSAQDGPFPTAIPSNQKDPFAVVAYGSQDVPFATTMPSNQIDPFAIVPPSSQGDLFATAMPSNHKDPFASNINKEDDPFATDLLSGDMSNGKVNQQNLLQQQQLWLQNQNKIIARHMTNV